MLWGVMLPILLLLVLPFTGKCWPFYRPGCWRCAADFTAVDAVLRTAARVDAAPLSAVGVGVMLPFIHRWRMCRP